VVLAPLAGIGNWFVRLQAKRHGAGMAVSEMVSSFGIHYGNEKTLAELLRIHPEERDPAHPAPTSIQLFGQDPEIMRSAAAVVAERGADLIDLNMGCPVPKVCKTGAGAALIKDPDTAVAVARAAREGSGLPVTVKLRSGQRPGETDGYALAHRLVDEAGVSAIGFHPRSAAVHHKGTPDYDLAVGVWKDGRIGSVKGLRKGKEDYGALVYGEKAVTYLPVQDVSYVPLVRQIMTFFRSGTSPVAPEETLEIMAFMDAAERSRLNGGRPTELAR
jgi:tRNA-dihydrouridine synthase